jgi:hypothetical protein
MGFTVFIFTLLVAFMVAGAVDVAEEQPLVVFSTHGFIALMAALALASVFCVVRRWKAWKRAGFHLTHLGAALLIFGGGVSHYRALESTGLQVPVNAEVKVGQIPRPRKDDEPWPTTREGDTWMRLHTVPVNSVLPTPDMQGGEVRVEMRNAAYVQNTRMGLAFLYEPVTDEDDELVDLPFSFSVTDFEVEYYNPDYTLFDVQGYDGTGPDPPELGTFRPDEAGKIDMKKYGVVPAAELKDAEGEWVQQYDVQNDYESEHDVDLVLSRGSRTPSHFEATVALERVEGGARTEQLMVNHPLSVEGWRVFLDSHGEGTVTLSIKRDPGRPYVYVGIAMLIVGTFVICFRKQGRLRCTSA